MAITIVSLIQKTPGVMGGEVCVRQTRITVWVLVGYRKLGLSDQKLFEAYPGLTQEDLEASWAYYRDHSHEIDEVIRRNEDE